MDRTELLGFSVLVGLWFVTILGGMALADEMAANNVVLFQDPGDVGNVGVFAVVVLVFTGLLLLAFRYANMTHVRAVLAVYVGMLGGTGFVVVTGVGEVAEAGSYLAGLPTTPIPIAVGLLTGVVLFVYPEWHVNNVAAVLFGAIAIPMLGLGFGPFPIVVLLVVWAAYDAYSVYVSGHMKELAAGVGDLKLPFVFVVPHSLSYSMVEDGLGMDLSADDDSVDEGPAAETEATDEGTGAAGPGVQLLGLGDAIIPGMLAVSAGEFLDAPTIVTVLNANLPAVGAVVGGFVGMAALLVLLHRFEGAHAGLPPLNAGVLAGYLVGAVAAGIPLTTALGL